MDIAEKMRELIPVLRAGINDIQYPDVSPECEGDWSEDYAIIQDVLPDIWGESEYFDFCRLYEDLHSLVKMHFAGDSSVVVKFYKDGFGGCGEIEVYREK